ncbi:MAG: MFS transporter [Acidiferrobacterales bacterium]
MDVETSVHRPIRSAKVVSLISTAHFVSHFYLLLLPPLFPMLREVYAVGFTELGFAIATFSVTTGLTQAPVGFLVDRYGARSILIAGLILESLAFGLIGVFPFYGALLALMVLGGLANAVYHPANYAILTASIDKARMGRAFSIHTFAGYLGAAVAPVTMIFLITFTDWRTALILCALGGGAMAVLLAFNSDALLDATDTWRAEAPSTENQTRGGFRLLFSLPILMGLLFFTGLSVSNHGLTSFSVSALNLIYNAPLAEAGAVLSAYLFASPVGVLIGGWIADRKARHDLIVALCLVAMAVAVFIIAAVALPFKAIALMFLVIGFLNGIVAPSRDMMIRAVTPIGEIGKVFGFVSTGYNIGGIAAPIAFGYLLDNANPALLFWAVGMVGLITVATVLITGRTGRHSRRPI